MTYTSSAPRPSTRDKRVGWEWGRNCATTCGPASNRSVRSATVMSVVAFLLEQEVRETDAETTRALPACRATADTAQRRRSRGELPRLLRPALRHAGIKTPSVAYISTLLTVMRDGETRASRQFGRTTVSITWITPFLAAMSVLMTLALLTVTPEDDATTFSA